MSTETSTNRSNQQNQATIVSLYDIDDLNAHHCGYCNQNGNISVGMASELMRIEDYQALIDRGWRRSGTYLYKPVMDKTCCPLYAIKCDITKFELKKSQRKVLKTVRKFLEKNEIKETKKSKKENNKKENKNISKSLKNNNNNNNNSNSETTSSSNKETKASSSQQSANKNLSNKSKNKEEKTNARKVMEFILENKEINDQPPNELLNIPKLKMKHKRLFKKLKLLKQKNLINQFSDIDEHLKRKNRIRKDTLEDYLLIDSSLNAKNKLETVLVRSWPPTKEFQASLNEEHEVYSRYQTTIHKDSPIECNMRQFQRFLCTSPLMPLSYDGPLTNLAQQEDISNIKIDKEIIGDLTNLGYGSFHQQYRLNGKIIAVGVIDILNYCMSSVYFFYDPAYQFLNLGTYSALREIAFTRQLNRLDKNINYYYLGFYAHECKKMRYKGQFNPSFLLCPEVYNWHPIEYCIEFLEKNKYSRFAPLKTNNDSKTSDQASCVLVEEITDDANKNETIDDVKIRVKFRDSEMKIFKFNEFCQFLNAGFVPQFTHMINGYCKLFGNQLSKRIIIKF